MLSIVAAAILAQRPTNPVLNPATRQIVDDMYRAYAKLKTYQDKGEVTLSGVAQLRFEIRYQAPGQLHFTYEYVPNYRKEKYGYRTQGAKTKQTYLADLWKPGEQRKNVPLRTAAATFAAITAGTSYDIPELLLPNQFTHQGLAREDLRLARTETYEGVACYVLLSNEAEYKRTIWVEKKRKLLRKITQEIGAENVQEQTTIYNPTLGPPTSVGSGKNARSAGAD